jgi:acetyl-CoA carboxylase carboxyltransferase component
VSAVLAREAAGRLDPRDRLDALCDPGSLQAVRTTVLSGRLGERAAAGDGVIGATGTVGGRPIACNALRAQAAAAGGFVDEIVEPVQTRAPLIWALRTLAGARA